MTAPGFTKRLGLTRADVVDALFAITLTLLGLVGFRFAFGRFGYMVVGTLAAIVGAAVALLIVRLKLPGLFALALASVLFLVLGAAVAVRDQILPDSCRHRAGSPA